MTDRLWFQNAVEGLFVRDLRGVLDRNHRAELKRLGLDVTKLQPAYPLETFRACLDFVAPLVAPGESPFEQQRMLGHRLTRGFFDTMLGHAMAKIVALVGPARGLSRIDRNFRSITNYVDAKVLEQQDRWARVAFSPTAGLTGLLLGISQASGDLLKRQSQTSGVSLVSEEGERAVMHFEWQV